MRNQTNTATLSPGTFADLMKKARACPGAAHLPHFGLFVGDWNYHAPRLVARAEGILRREGIAFTKVTQAAPAMFWFTNEDGKLQLHEWTNQKEITQ